MAQLLVRKLDEGVKLRLRQRATQHGRSMEAEVRDILTVAVGGDTPRGGLGSEIAGLFVDDGLRDDETWPEFRGHDLPSPFE